MEKNYFDQFQLEEYKNISSAHFETNKQIGLFFRYFLIIASAPAAVLIWLGNQDKFFNDLFDKSKSINNNLFIGFFLLIVSFIGICTCFYIISFRMDSILYARSVNGIRKYFYEREFLKYEERYRVLPKYTSQPKYRQIHTFTIIVFCFALINCSYFALGSSIIAAVGDKFFGEYFFIKIPIIFPNYNLSLAILLSVILFLLHLLYYRIVSEYRTFYYLKSQRIGIDIDGVLNKQSDTFCEFLKKITGIELSPSEITVNPVHRIPNSKVSIQDASLVFHSINYWESHVPKEEDMWKIIKELRNSYGYKINIYSSRPWPDRTNLPDEIVDKTMEEWWKYSIKWLPFIKGISNYRIYINRIRFKTIDQITRKWLHDNKIKFDKLMIERGTIDSNSVRFFFNAPRINFRNRYLDARKNSFRYFIEDTLENAIKLSANCDYVFLFDQPYNNKTTNEIPKNILRVYSWEEIKQHIRELG